MLANIFKILSVLIPFSIIGSCLYSIKKVKVEDLYPVKYDTVYIERIDTVKITDTLYINQQSKYFKTFGDIKKFLAYLKTQSGRLDEDNYAAIWTLFNRMDKEKCDWNTYFNTPRINNSNTIKKMIAGTKKVSVDFTDLKDLLLLERIIDCNFGYNPLNVPPNVLYFESHKTSPNKGIFRKSKIWREYRHRFYLGELEG